MKHLILAFFLIFSTLNLHAQTSDSASMSTPASEKKIAPRSLSVIPAKLSFDLDRGGTSKQTVTISNTTDQKYQINLELIDWERDSVGNHVYYIPGFHRSSCARWVTFDNPYVEVGPGETRTVTVTMAIPDSAEAVEEMKWAMLLAKTVSEKKASQKGAVTTEVTQSSAIGIHLYQTPPNVKNKEVRMLSFSELPGKQYRVTCKNVGGVQAMGNFSVELASMETNEKIVIGNQEVPLFPGQQRSVDFKLPDTLAKGKYTAVALIDLGDDEIPLEVAQKEIEIK